MKLAVGVGAMGPPGGENIIKQAIEAENLGYDSIWSAEIYGTDCFTPLAWIGAHTEKIKLGTSIMQISARTPASAAMHAVTLDYLSNGRFNLGIGVSGPQVVEGWYGQPYPRPLERTREWIEIFRKIVAREEPVSFEGKHYQLPHKGGMGLGKPLKLIQHPVRPEIPLYLGAEGPKNVALGAELCNGWIPMLISPYRMGEVYKESLAHKPPDFDIVAGVQVIITDDIPAALDEIRQGVGFYIGGMGAKSFNVHKDHVSRQGFAEAADKVQELFLAGKRDQAIAAVPDELVDELSLVGPKERIRERLAAWRESAVTTITVRGNNDALRFMAEEVL